MKIMLVDDNFANRMLLRKMIGQMEGAHQTIEAENGLQAVELFQREKPDLILMDILMPVMNGLEAIKRIRDFNIGYWVPIIILSALHDENVIVNGLEAGGDDYLTKPINHIILKAKIRSMLRVVKMQEQILADAKRLQEYHSRNEAELAFAKHVFDRIIGQMSLQDKPFQFWLYPARGFSGDLICCQRDAQQRLYFMLADSTGHGLAAALPTILVKNIFQAMSLKSLSIAAIAREINARLYLEMPTGRFVALLLGRVDFACRRIEIWNGGLPEVVVLSEESAIIQRFPSVHTFAGILDDAQFDTRTMVWHWQERCELLAYSDGLLDVMNSQGELFGESRLLATLTHAPPGQRIERLREAVFHFRDPAIEHDDLSCLVVMCQE